MSGVKNGIERMLDQEQKPVLSKSDVDEIFVDKASEAPLREQLKKFHAHIERLYSISRSLNVRLKKIEELIQESEGADSQELEFE